MRYHKILTPICLLAFPVTAHATDCQPAFVNGDQSLIVNGVEIEPGGRATQDFQIRIQNSNGVDRGRPDNPSGMSGSVENGPCEATIRFARVGASPNPDFPPYVLRAPGNRQIEILPDLSSGGTADSDIIIANAPSGAQGRAVPLQIGVTTEWGLRAGTYIEQLELSLIDREGNIADRTTLTVTIVIPPTVSLRLVGAILGGGGSGPARIDLGNLSSSKETRSERFGARIFSTAPYVVTFSSVNLGMLLHEQRSEQVPYRLYFDGALVDLAGTNEFPYLYPTPKAGDRRPMRIVVPPVVALAGRYSDRITVTVSAM